MLPVHLHIGYPHGVDEQHAKLFEICDRLRQLTLSRMGDSQPSEELDTLSGIHRAIKAGKVPSHSVDAETMAACSDVVRYTMEHFEWEQEILAAADFAIVKSNPQLYDAFSAHYRKHLSEHASLHQHAMIYRSQFEEHLVSALSLYVFVRHWLVSHISKTDREFAYWCRIADGLPGTPPTL
jgi:hemerythrin